MRFAMVVAAAVLVVEVAVVVIIEHSSAAFEPYVVKERVTTLGSEQNSNASDLRRERFALEIWPRTATSTE